MPFGIAPIFVHFPLVWMKLFRSKKGALLFDVILQLHNVKGLEKFNGTYVFWKYDRGTHSGTTLKSLVANGVANWDDSTINLQCSMFNNGDDAFDSKVLELNLKEVRNEKCICCFKIDFFFFEIFRLFFENTFFSFSNIEKFNVLLLSRVLFVVDVMF